VSLGQIVMMVQDEKHDWITKFSISSRYFRELWKKTKIPVLVLALGIVLIVTAISIR